MDAQQLVKVYNGLNSINLSLSLLGTQTTIHDGSWEHFNKLVDQAAQLTSDDHITTSKIQSSTDHKGRPFVRVGEYATKVYAATRYIYDQYHEQYFDDDIQPPTLKGTSSYSPANVIHNTQNQEAHQSQKTEVNIEFNQTFQYVTEQLIRAEDKFKDGTPEKGFINKLKSVVSTARSTADIIKLIAATAAETGLAAEALKRIFS